MLNALIGNPTWGFRCRTVPSRRYTDVKRTMIGSSTSLAGQDTLGEPLACDAPCDLFGGGTPSLRDRMPSSMVEGSAA